MTKTAKNTTKHPGRTGRLNDLNIFKVYAWMDNNRTYVSRNTDEEVHQTVLKSYPEMKLPLGTVQKARRELEIPQPDPKSSDIQILSMILNNLITELGMDTPVALSDLIEKTHTIKEDNNG